MQHCKSINTVQLDLVTPSDLMTRPKDFPQHDHAGMHFNTAQLDLVTPSQGFFGSGCTFNPQAGAT